MSTTESLKNTFAELVEAYEDADEEAKEFLAQKIKVSGKSFRVDIEEYLQWEESQVEGYKECPLITQSITVFLDEEAVCEVERWFGSEKVDSTHTGLGGRWETIRVDENENEGLIQLLEDFGYAVDDPDVPEWR